MKVLVTGATGFIGSKVCKSLLEQGHEVNYLTRSKTKDGVPGAKGFLWNPYKEEIDLECLEDVEVIIHLVGSSIAASWSAKGKKLILDSRIIPSAFLHKVLASNPHHVKQLIAASAIGIYSSVDEIQDEENFQLADNFLGQVVKKWEEGNLAFKNINIRVSLIRIGLVLDMHEGALAAMVKPIKLGLGASIGSGKQYYSWIHSKDLVRMFIYVLEHQLLGVYNAVSPEPLTNRQFTISLGKAMKRPIWLPAIPTAVMRFVLGEKAILVTEGQRVDCRKIKDTGFDFRFSRIKEALDDLLLP